MVLGRPGTGPSPALTVALRHRRAPGRCALAPGTDTLAEPFTPESCSAAQAGPLFCSVPKRAPGWINVDEFIFGLHHFLAFVGRIEPFAPFCPDGRKSTGEALQASGAS